MLTNAADAAHNRLGLLLMPAGAADANNGAAEITHNIIWETISTLANKHADHAAGILWEMVSDEVRKQHPHRPFVIPAVVHFAEREMASTLTNRPDRRSLPARTSYHF